jgi:hypothetical protein
MDSEEIRSGRYRGNAMKAETDEPVPRDPIPPPPPGRLPGIGVNHKKPSEPSPERMIPKEFGFWEQAFLAAMRAGESPPEYHADRALKIWRRRREIVDDAGHHYRGPRR